LDTKLQYVIQEPELREYFYSNKLFRLMILLGIKFCWYRRFMPTRLDLGLAATSDVQRAAAVESWSAYAQFILQTRLESECSSRSIRSGGRS
jgi:hypothetical protein